MKIVASGDIALCKGVEKMILGGSGDQIAQGLRGILKAGDLFLANIECPLTNYEYPARDYLPALKAKREAGKILGELGVNVASLANNHIGDYGIKGLRDTISVLEEQGIAWCGVGSSLEDANRPLIINKNGYKIGVLALAQPENSAARKRKWGAGVLEYSTAIQGMRRLSEEVDVAIAYLHFGVELFGYPTPGQVRLSRALIDEGALIVLGHHPHVPQGYEHYKNGFIAYSLGNFIFDMNAGTDKFSKLGLVIEAEVGKHQLRRVEVIPVDTTSGNPRLFPENEKKEAMKYLETISSVLSNKDELKKSYYFVCKGNFDTHREAFAYYGFKRSQLRRIREILFAQFLPQILKLRVDLFRFLISGEALDFEKKRGMVPRGSASTRWRSICRMASLVGYGWGKLLRVNSST